MKKIGIIMLIALFAACNNAGTGTNTTDTAAAKDKTNMNDTGAGGSMADTAHHQDTSNKMHDTSAKK